jgi:competence protein ComEA
MTVSRRIPKLALVLALACAATSLSSAGTAAARGGTEMRATAPVGDKPEQGEKVNINTADVKELMRLAGVHKKTAEKIVEYRQAHGLFKKPEEVVKVDGIGHGLYEKNRARIVVE